MAGEEEELSRYSWFISERQEYQDGPVGHPRQRSMGAGLSWTNRRQDWSRSEVSHPTGHQGGDHGRKCTTESRRDSQSSRRTARHVDFHGERASRRDQRNDRWGRDFHARRDVMGGRQPPSRGQSYREMSRREGTVRSQCPEGRRDSGGRSWYTHRASVNQNRQQHRGEFHRVLGEDSSQLTRHHHPQGLKSPDHPGVVTENQPVHHHQPQGGLSP